MAENFQLGYFLTEDLWQQSCNLVRKQIDLVDKNRHFNTLSTIYYKNLKNSDFIFAKEYFTSRIANNIFYGLEDEFFNEKYVILKNELGLRDYSFLSLSMIVLYNCIGLYLVQITQNIIDTVVSKNKRVNSFYGGELTFKNKKLVLTENNIYYQNYYRQFRKNIRKSVTNNEDRKVAICLDIENFFNNISIEKLLSNIHSISNPSTRIELKFDEFTTKQIHNILTFLTGGPKGLLQGDNNIISSYLAHTYLIRFDLSVDDWLKTSPNLSSYSISRYVDDIYIILEFKEDTNSFDKDNFVISLITFILNYLHNNLDLRLNSKSTMYRLGDEEEKTALMARLRRVSPRHYIADDEKEITPQDKVNKILETLKILNEAPFSSKFYRADETIDEDLKEVFDKRVNQLFSRLDNNQNLYDVLINFNFEVVKVYPLPLIVLICKVSSVKSKFYEYLKQKPSINIIDIDVYIKFYCQNHQEHSELIDFMEKSYLFSNIASKIRNITTDWAKPGYFNLDWLSISKILTKPHIIEQIRLRVFNEKQRNYSVALNHLVNELHSISYLFDNNRPTNVNNYDAIHVLSLLISKNALNSTILNVTNMFNSRNINQVSHASTNDGVFGVVSAKDYIQYRDCVGECLSIILTP